MPLVLGGSLLYVLFVPQFWRNVANTNGDTLQAAKLKLKERLLETVRPTNRGISTSEEQRQDIEELITALEPCKSTIDEGSCYTVVRGSNHERIELTFAPMEFTFFPSRLF